MEHYRYETHRFSDPRLPFIFHPCHTIRTRELPPNWHENIELLLCIGGSGYVRCGAQELDFHPGDFFVVNPDTPHVVISSTSVSYRCLIVSRSFFEENGIPSLWFQPMLRDDRLADLMEQVHDAYRQHRSGSPFAIADYRLAVLALLRLLCLEYTVPQTAPSVSGEHVKAALTYIRANLDKNASLQEVADQIGLSKYHLARQFKHFTGSTFTQTANLIRCLEAKRLIEGGMQVSQAATACGFDNLSYFSRTYKKLLQELPSQHKKSR